MLLTKVSRNLHTLELTREESRLAILSDLHWDNPKCDRDMLKRHLDYCLKESIPVMVVGDLFCLMQGKGDRRGNKSDIRPEHNNAKYLDSIVETAVDWFSPYASILTVIGYGNHETAIIKYQETDLLQRFVDLMNYKNKSNIFTGGYGGWMVIKKNIRTNTSMSKTLKYFHGSGGGGIVTKGAINLTRALETYENMDVFVMGHIHENSSRNDVRDALQYNTGKHTYELIQKQIHLAITGTYKEEYVDGFGGWHVERGAPIKPLGGRILTLNGLCDRRNNLQAYEVLIDSHKFPL
jgi:UDP-2,3-diacylglucosamine pyrophosphatase LpxH